MEKPGENLLCREIGNPLPIMWRYIKYRIV